ncbi:MAG: DEAD/DEAH box helicase [Candidatus Omnitrophica bacterium]|nr:DEAD/DEAH box helicase [Candidatus Omnitrophota bacterium]
MIHSLSFAVGEEVVLEERLAALRDLGYTREPEVTDPATFTHRGGILDVFPWGFSFPIRISLEDNTIETLHSYDPASGKLLEPHRMVVVLPTASRTSARRLKRIEWQWGEKPVQPFVDIEPGDHVVHVGHGIGIFRGVKKLSVPGAEKSKPHLVLEYAGAENLYVSLDDLGLVQRYIAPGVASQVRLSKLGTKAWLKIRARAQEGILAYAKDLLELQAQRELLSGHAFGPPGSWEQQLASGFAYEETADQKRAIEDVTRDMMRARPMDRLICGDVGYGKTEVAIRAVFKSVAGGKQAAVLVPTTLLAEQHMETFRSRFEPFGMRVEMLSRFQSRTEQLTIIRALATGECDVVIGTHRLLSDDIRFKDLGLVVIDEEQRFGVKHKEKLKHYRTLVDVLTLTATPIPRTLYMSLVGGKDMSVVNSPPTNRLAIETRLMPYNAGIIREGIRRELGRKGQVFFIHNRVEGIEREAERVRRAAPEARIAVAHGQMHSSELEAVMHQFIHGQIDVLVATTIIESGIDIPNANTIFINRADQFGLSELYQLKGRVGRYDRKAYAYLLIPQGAVLTHESQRRLGAVERHSHLGAGFQIAMEDLEIRGAGNLLGMEQSGYVSTIGFDLYCRLLKDAIDSLKTRPNQ